MASRGVTTDLVIRATEIKTKPLDDLLVTLGRLTTALGELDAEGGPASKSFSELTAEAKKFEAISSELSGRRALFEVFKQAKEGADLAGKALEQAKRRLEEFNATTPAPKGRTDAQREEFKALDTALKQAASSFRLADKSAATAEDKLARIGVTAANVAGELGRLIAADEQAAAGFLRATQNAQGYQEAIRQQAAALKAKALAEKEAAAATQAGADASRKAEQAEHDRLALLEQVGRAQQKARGQEQLQEELRLLAAHEAALRADRDAQQQRAAEALKTAKRLEQAEHDRLALLEKAGRTQQGARGQEQMQEELRLIAEHEAAVRKDRAAEEQRAAAIAATTKALNAQKVAEKEAAASLRATAAAAEKSAAENATLARALELLTRASAPLADRGLAQGLAAVIDPARKAAMSMTEVGAALRAVSDRQGDASKSFQLAGPALKKLTEEQSLLARAMKDTERQAGAIEGYQRANAEFASSKQVLDRARQALEQYAAQARTAGTSDAALEEGLRKQRAELDAATASYRKHAGAVTSASAKARDAGVDLQNLADAERAVTQQAQALRGAMDATSASLERLSQASKAGGDFGKALASQRAAEDAERKAGADEWLKLMASQRAAEEQRAAAIAATTKALNAQKVAEKEAAINLRATGMEAQEAARATGTLAQAARELAGTSTASTKGLSQAIGEIVDPARRATLSMSEIQRELVGLTARQREAEGAFHMTGPALKQLATDHEFLSRALRETEAQAGLIEGYQRAQRQFNETGASLDRARQALEQYAAQARAAGTSDAALEAGLRQQRAELDALLAAYQRQAQALSAMGTRARDAGVDLQNLADAERAVTQQAQALRGAMDAASSSTSKLGQATEQARSAQGKWGEEQRTALSLSQRVRGQILSLTAAYVGLFGVINEARASLDAVTSLQGINNKLEVAFGKDAPQELARIQKEADRLGISFQAAAEGYSRFAVAAREGGATADETFYIFSKFSETSRVFKLSTEEQKRIFKALEQIMSKGKISAEELTQQLGDSLPGAISKMAKAMNVPPAELFKMMEKGQISSKNIIQLAKQYGDSVAPQLAKASDSWQAHLSRLESALFFFREKVGSGGFAEDMGRLAQSLTGALNSQEGAQAAQALSDVFSAVALTLSALVPVVVGFGRAIGGAIETVKSFATGALEIGRAFQEWRGVDPATPALTLNTALKELGGILAEGTLLAGVLMMVKFGGAATDAYKVVKAFGAAVYAALAGEAGMAGAAVIARGGIAALTAKWVALNAVSKAFVLIGVYEVFKAIGEWARDSFVFVRKLGEGIAFIGAVMVAAATPGASVKDTIGQWNKLALESEADDRRKLARAKQISQVQVDGARLTSQEMARRGGSQAKAAKAATDAESARLAARAKMAAENRIAGGKPTILNADTPKAKGGKSETAKAADSYASLLKQVEGGVDALELRSAKTGAQELNDAIAALDKQYESLYESIAKLNAKDEAAMRKRADAAKAALVVEIKQEFARKAAAAKVISIQEERDALLEVAKAQAEVDPSKALSAQQEQIAIIARYKDELLAAANAALVLAESQGKVVEAAKLKALITKTAAFDPVAESRKAQIEDAQKELALQQSIRDAKIAAAVEVANQNDPTGQTAAAETVRIMTEFQQGLTDTATKIKELALAAGNLPLAAQMDGMLAKLSVVDTKLLEIRKSVTDTFASGLTGAMTTGYDALAKWVSGVGSFGNAWVSARDAFRSFAADFLMNIAKMIIQQQALNVAQSLMGGGQGAGFVGPQEPSLMSTGISWLKGLVTMHNGGTVGGATGWSQSAPAAAFAGAPRFHGGGLPGLARDEVPAILQKGEEVLSKDNPRNILNGGGMAGSAPAAAAQPFTIVNTFKPEEVVAAGLSDRAFINYVAANKTSIKKVLG